MPPVALTGERPYLSQPFVVSCLFLICAGFNTGGEARQESSNFRMAVLSIAPALYIAEAEVPQHRS